MVEAWRGRRGERYPEALGGSSGDGEVLKDLHAAEQAQAMCL